MDTENQLNRSLQVGPFGILALVSPFGITIAAIIILSTKISSEKTINIAYVVLLILSILVFICCSIIYLYACSRKKFYFGFIDNSQSNKN